MQNVNASYWTHSGVGERKCLIHHGTVIAFVDPNLKSDRNFYGRVGDSIVLGPFATEQEAMTSVEDTVFNEVQGA